VETHDYRPSPGAMPPRRAVPPVEPQTRGRHGWMKSARSKPPPPSQEEACKALEADRLVFVQRYCGDRSQVQILRKAGLGAPTDSEWTRLHETVDLSADANYRRSVRRLMRDILRAMEG
jgi:hypothetical protein